MKKITFYLALSIVLFTACNNSDLEVKKEVFGGYAQKGPFVNGSSVTISELNADLDQTGRVYITTIADNSGSFEKKNIELVSSYVELKADGYYFNEIWGLISQSQITLYALADVKDVNSANVNVLTHLEKPRVEYLVKQEGLSFSEAKKQAQNEVLAVFGFGTSAVSSETLSLTDNAVLLAVSCILQGYLSPGNMMELMADIAADIKTDGVLNNEILGSKLIDNAHAVSGSTVRDNLTQKYTELGKNINVPDFESYIQSFIDSKLYPISVFITYPHVGSFGNNILSDATTYVKKGLSEYNMSADVPEGQSLKIILKDGYWGYMTIPHPVNWSVSQYDRINRRQEFTVTESGKISDLMLAFDEGTMDENNQTYITIEYYENNAVTPTKVRTLHVYDSEK